MRESTPMSESEAVRYWLALDCRSPAEAKEVARKRRRDAQPGGIEFRSDHTMLPVLWLRLFSEVGLPIKPAPRLMLMRLERLRHVAEEVLLYQTLVHGQGTGEEEKGRTVILVDEIAGGITRTRFPGRAFKGYTTFEMLLASAPGSKSADLKKWWPYTEKWQAVIERRALPKKTPKANLAFLKQQMPELMQRLDKALQEEARASKVAGAAPLVMPRAITTESTKRYESSMRLPALVAQLLTHHTSLAAWKFETVKKGVSAYVKLEQGRPRSKPEALKRSKQPS